MTTRIVIETVDNVTSIYLEKEDIVYAIGTVNSRNETIKLSDNIDSKIIKLVYNFMVEAGFMIKTAYLKFIKKSQFNVIKRISDAKIFADDKLIKP